MQVSLQEDPRITFLYDVYDAPKIGLRNTRALRKGYSEELIEELIKIQWIVKKPYIFDMREIVYALTEQGKTTIINYILHQDS